MSTPRLRILPDTASAETHDAMDLLGGTLIAGVLGTYQANKDAADALLVQCLSLHEAGEVQTDHSRRLYLYSMLATEALS